MTVEKPFYDQEKMIWLMPNGDAVEDVHCERLFFVAKPEMFSDALIRRFSLITAVFLVIASALLFLATAALVLLAYFTKNVISRIYRMTRIILKQ